jgi:hypothetical protein
MHVHPDIAIAIVAHERRPSVAAPRRAAAAAPARRVRLGTAVVRLGARLGRLDVTVVAGRRGWRGRTVTVSA